MVSANHGRLIPCASVSFGKGTCYTLTSELRGIDFSGNASLQKFLSLEKRT